MCSRRQVRHCSLGCRELDRHVQGEGRVWRTLTFLEAVAEVERESVRVEVRVFNWSSMNPLWVWSSLDKSSCNTLYPFFCSVLSTLWQDRM